MSISIKSLEDRVFKKIIVREVRRLKQKDNNITVEQVMQDVDKKNLVTIVQRGGYTRNDIARIVEEILK